MAGNHTQTDSALMEQTAAKFEAVNAELQTTLTNLRNKVADLQAGWVGQGATSFQNTMASWTRNQDTINKLLEQTAGLIRSAGRDYATSDTDTAQRFTTTTDTGPVYHGL